MTSGFNSILICKSCAVGFFIYIFAQFLDNNKNMEKKHWELKKLRDAIERERSWKPLKPLALKKVIAYLQGLEKPKKETLDRMSLFVGFQDWDSFKDALSGDADAETNYEGDKYADKIQKKEKQPKENKNRQ